MQVMRVELHQYEGNVLGAGCRIEIYSSPLSTSLLRFSTAERESVVVVASRSVYGQTVNNSSAVVNFKFCSVHRLDSFIYIMKAQGPLIPSNSIGFS